MLKLAKLSHLELTRRTACLLPILAACRKQLSPTVFVDPALATLVAPDTTAMAGIRMQQIQGSPLYRRYIEAGKLPLLQRFSASTGLTAIKDLWEVLIASDPRGISALARGKFSEMGMEPRVEREGVKRFGYKGFTLLGSDDAVVAFLNPTTAIAGPPRVVHHLIDHRNETSGLPAEIQGRITQIPSSNQIWFAGNLRSILTNAPLPLARVADSLKFVSGGIDVRSGVRLDALGETLSAEDANRLRDTVRGLAGMARLNTPPDRNNLLRFYDSLRVESASSHVRVHMDAGADLLDEVLRLIGLT